MERISTSHTILRTGFGYDGPTLGVYWPFAAEKWLERKQSRIPKGLLGATGPRGRVVTGDDRR